MQEHLEFSPVYEITIQNGVAATSDPSTNGPLIGEYRVNLTGPSQMQEPTALDGRRHRSRTAVISAPLPFQI
jgi:hypothetical protein